MKENDYKALSRLVERVKDQDQEAFTELYNHTCQKIYLLALSITKDPNLSEDILQEVYIRMLHSLGSLRDNRLLTAWLNQITYNTAVTMMKKQKEVLYPDAEDYVDESLHSEDSPLMSALKTEQERRLMNYVLRLTMDQRTIIIMHYYQNFKLNEIARILSCPLNTVKSRFNSAKKKLRMMMKADDYFKTYAFSPFFLFILHRMIRSLNITLLTPEKAGELLRHILKNGIKEAAGEIAKIHAFLAVPVVAAVKPELIPGVFGAIAGTAATAAAVTVSAMALAAPPSVSSVRYSESLTNQPLEITADINHSSASTKVLLMSPSGVQSEAVWVDGSHYRAEAYENGEYSLVVEDGEHRAVKSFTINNIDLDSPLITSYQLEQNELLIQLEDQASGLNIQSARMEDKEGSLLAIPAYDQEKQSFRCPVLPHDFYFVLSDNAGNECRFKIERLAEAGS